ncbi:hypothetical protein CRG98_005083 [Punica granatum]|uniref:Aminotransferase-like plant mobile domain-containing protein n=1 Tax=Punica granatum TaxID=22663 RepID=A0A2I0L1F4_PUNGR|nr:hypothetical protein CRG98_005083 [Punica granatum]
MSVTALLQRPMSTRDIIVPNEFVVIQSQFSILLGMSTKEGQLELQNGWEHSVRTTWLLNWTHIHALCATGESYQCNAYHGEIRRGMMRGSPHLLQIWLLADIRPFCSSHPFSYIIDDRSLIACLRLVFQPSEHTFSEWRQFLEEFTPTQFLWTARWNPGGPMITGCTGIVGLPHLCHLESTLVFPSRVIRQLGGLQDIPTKADRLAYRFMWADSSSTNLYFLEYPTDDERVFSATSAYVAQFYSQDSVPVHWPRTAPIEVSQQLLQKPRASPKRPCVRSCSLSGRSEIDFAASLLILVQSLQITEGLRGT